MRGKMLCINNIGVEQKRCRDPKNSLKHLKIKASEKMIDAKRAELSQKDNTTS